MCHVNESGLVFDKLCFDHILLSILYLYLHIYICEFKSRFISHAWKNRANYSAEYVVHGRLLLPAVLGQKNQRITIMHAVMC